MRSFAEMPVWLLAIYGILFVVMTLGAIIGYVIVKDSKDNVNRIFGGFIQFLAMFVSIPVFLIGIISTTPAEKIAESSVSALNVFPEIMIWGSLTPLLIIPAFIVGTLISEYYQITGSTRSKQGNSVSLLERVKVHKLAGPAVRSWKISRATFLSKPFTPRVAQVRATKTMN